MGSHSQYGLALAAAPAALTIGGQAEGLSAMIRAMSTLLRPAEAADLPAILEIYNHAVLHSTASYDHQPATLESRAAWLREREQDGFPVLVAVQGEQVVGWASYGPFRSRLGYSRTVEHSVYLAPAAQGRGLGGELLEALLQRAQAAGMHTMIGVIDAENTASIRFHQRHGFTEAGRLSQIGHKFGRWLDITLMVRQLGETAAPPHAQP